MKPRAERAHPVATLLAMAGLAVVSGCASKPPPPEPVALGDSDWVWTEDGADTSSTGLESLISRQANDLRDLSQAGRTPTPQADTRRESAPPIVIDRPVSPAAHRTDEPTNPQPQDGLLRALSLAGGGPGVLRADPVAAAPVPQPSDETPTNAENPTRGARIAELAGELASLLKEDSIESPDPGRPLVAAALLESIAGGVLPEADLPGAGPLMLTEAERASLLTLRELAVRLVGGAEADLLAGDPQRVRQILLDSAESLREHARVQITKAELCTRAPGFGSYIPLKRRTFLAGRSNRIVVYAEVDHFGLRPATTNEAAVVGDTVAAELTQEMELYLSEGDPQPTWQRTVNWLPRTSRRGFRDMFVATPIELPSTLSVGEYDLKVRVIDEVTGAQDETIIAIRLVADPSALDDEPVQTHAGGTPPQSGGILPAFARSQSK